MLVGQDGDLSVWENIFALFRQELLNHNMYQDVADLSMVMADVCINTGLPTESTIAAVHLGEALEAAKKYTDAGKVYMAVAGKNFPVNTLVCSEINAANCAGLAFKRAQDYVQAEEQYVRAIRSLGTDWTWSDDGVGNALNNMMCFYEVVHWAVQGGQIIDEEHKKIEYACVLLVALLSFAGYRGHDGCSLFCNGYQKPFQRYLKEEYKEPQKAMRALIAAFSTPNIEEYRKVLFGCSQYPCLPVIKVVGKDAEYRGNLAQVKTTSKEAARRLLTDEGSIAIDMLLRNCNGCDEQFPLKTMKRCPCQTVLYCSRECQVAHWKIHKRTCTHRKSLSETAVD